MTDLPSNIGPYSVEGELGRGGMGVVYLGRDADLDRRVAIKVLPEEVAEDPERLARFEREAKLLAALSHPNIGGIYRVGTDAGRRYLALEYVSGETLAERLERGPMTLEEALGTARQIAEAIEAAHERGIVHRDLKPANVKITDDGTVKVLDFGLARAFGDEAEMADLTQSPTLTAGMTRAGFLIGTAAYMSPEQARGQEASRQSDIWSFGVILWEMLSGERLFAGDTMAESLAEVLKREVEVRALPAHVPAAVQRLLRRCLERTPRSRLHDIADARIVLEDVLDGRMEATPSSGGAAPAAGRRSPIPWIAAGLAGLVLGFLGARVLEAPEPAPEAVVTEVPRIRTLVAGAGGPAASRDGKTLAFVKGRDGEPEIWIKDLTSGSESPLVPSPAWNPAFSADGTSLLYSTVGEDEDLEDLHRLALATRADRVVVRSIFKGGTWSPDGRRIAFLGSPAAEGGVDLVAVDVESGVESVLEHLTATASGQGPDYPRWSPGGRRIAVPFTGGQAGTDSAVGILDLDGDGFEMVPVKVPGIVGSVIEGVGWLSEDRLLLVLRDGYGTVTLSGRLALLDLATGVTCSLMPLQPVFGGLAVLAPDGAAVGLGATEQSLHALTREEGGGWSSPRRLTEGPFTDRQPVVSPDGRRVLFTSDRSGNLDIWRLDRESGELQRLTDHPAEDWDPAWSPDGRKILFSSNRSGRFQIWTADADGSAPRQITDVENAQNPTFTADGAWIAFTRQGTEAPGVWRVRPDGSELGEVAEGLLFRPDAGPGVVASVDPAASQAGLLRLARVADGTLLPGTDREVLRLRWSDLTADPRLWILGGDPAGENQRIYSRPFDPVAGSLGSADPVPTDGVEGVMETFGVSGDGSVVVVSTVTTTGVQVVQIDGLRSLLGESPGGGE